MQFAGSHILSVDQFERDDIKAIFEVADRMEPYAHRRRVTRVLDGAILGAMFFEPSTRTRVSFGCAFNLLGGQVRETTGFEHSAIAKGESLYDTARVISGYSDVIAMRHPEPGSVAEFAGASRVPVINGGDGANEHPSQALLDLYTIRSEMRGDGNGIDGLRIALIGDLRYGRTVHSLCKLLTLFSGLTVHLISPEELRMPGDIVESMRSAGHQVTETEDLEAHIAHVDIAYSTRIQEERFRTREEADLYRGRFRLNQNVYTRHCEPNTVIMHPLPRDSRSEASELDNDLNDNPNLAIFRQADNGGAGPHGAVCHDSGRRRSGGPGGARRQLVHRRPVLAVTERPGQDSGLLRSSAVVGTMTMLSRALGLLRDIVIAGLVGASANADAFFVAFKVPNFLRRLFAEGAFAQAFIPVLAEYRQEGTAAAVKGLIDRVAGVLGGTLLTLTALVTVGAPVVAAVFAPGFLADPHKYALTADLLRVTFPYLFLISMTGFCGAVLNGHGRFAVPAFTPVLLNLSLIAAALFAAPLFDEPVFALAWGVMLAGVVQLLFQLPFLYRLELVPRPRWDTRDSGVRQVAKLMVPALFGVSVSQINLLLDTVLASFLPTGSVSWLYYSDRLTDLPLGVFGVAVATVILPRLSDLQAGAVGERFAETLDWALRAVLLIGLPASVALMILAEPIMLSLFQYGAMEAEDARMASLSLQAYCIGLLAFMLVKVLAPGYYARRDMATPVKVGIVAMVANIVMNLIFVWPLHSIWGVGHVGLALATSLAACLNAGLLLRGLRRDDVLTFQPGWGAFCGPSAAGHRQHGAGPAAGPARSGDLAGLGRRRAGRDDAGAGDGGPGRLSGRADAAGHPPAGLPHGGAVAPAGSVTGVAAGSGRCAGRPGP